MKTLPTHPSARRLSPCTGGAHTSHSPLCCGNLDTFLHNTAAAAPTHHPPHLALSACRCHILHKIMLWEPCSPSCPLHPDLDLTSNETGVSRPDSCRLCGQVAGSNQPRPVPRHLPSLAYLQWEGSPT